MEPNLHVEGMFRNSNKYKFKPLSVYTVLQKDY